MKKTQDHKKRRCSKSTNWRGRTQVANQEGEIKTGVWKH